MNVAAFGPNFSKTKTLAVTATTNSVTLDATDVSSTPTPASSGLSGGHSVMRVVSVGPNVAFLRFGVGAQTALTSDMPILPNTVELFSKGGDIDTVAAIAASGQTATLYITCGEGA